MNHNFKIVNADTDAISFSKLDDSKFTQEEQNKLIDEINNLMDDGIEFEHDGYYDRFIVVKAKNYVILEHGKDKIKYMGSSFKDSKKEPALKELMLKVTESLIHNGKDYVEIYNDYFNEVMNIKDMSRWVVKKSITENLIQGNDTTKKKVLNAIKDIKYSVGDKVYLYNDIQGKKQSTLKGELVFYKKTGEPKMVDNEVCVLLNNFCGSYNLKHYLKRLYKTMEILKPVIDMDKIKNYSTSKNFKELTNE